MKKMLGIVLIVLVLGGVVLGVGEIVDEIFDYDDGRLTYELGNAKSGRESDVVAATGVVLESEKERDDNLRGTQSEAKKEVKAVTQPETKPATQTTNKTTSDDIGKEKAKEIALQNAGVTLDQVIWEEVERDYDDGRLEYQVEFRVGNKEYDYEIDAATGTILERDFDWDDDDRWDD